MSAPLAACAVLAAGASARMGGQKLLLAVDGRTLLDRALAATAGYPTVVVASPAVREAVPPAAGRRVVVNAEPDRGMTHSLRIADALVDPESSLVVVLADTPLVDAALIARMAGALGDADVAFPVRGGRPGHPVVFGPRARRALGALPEGDTLRVLRDDPRWRRIEVQVDGPAPFTDVDTPADLAALDPAGGTQTPLSGV